jgi:hypothetical protein
VREIERVKPNGEFEKRCMAPEWGLDREDPERCVRTGQTVALLASVFGGVRRLGIEEGEGAVRDGDEVIRLGRARKRVIGKRKVSPSAEDKEDGKKRKDSKRGEGVEEGEMIEVGEE